MFVTSRATRLHDQDHQREQCFTKKDFLEALYIYRLYRVYMWQEQQFWEKPEQWAASTSRRFWRLILCAMVRWLLLNRQLSLNGAKVNCLSLYELYVAEKWFFQLYFHCNFLLLSALQVMGRKLVNLGPWPAALKGEIPMCWGMYGPCTIHLKVAPIFSTAGIQ